MHFRLSRRILFSSRVILRVNCFFPTDSQAVPKKHEEACRRSMWPSPTAKHPFVSETGQSASQSHLLLHSCCVSRPDGPKDGSVLR